MCLFDHQIEINNLKDNDIFDHSITLLKGSFITNCNCTSELKIIQNNNKQQQIVEICQKKSNYRFISVIELTLGENFINLTYCNTNLNIKIFYKKRYSDYVLTPIYIILDGHDGHFQSDNKNNDSISACKRITLGIKLIQYLIAQKLYEQGYDRRTFIIEEDCKIFNSKLNINDAKKIHSEKLWEYFAHEIIFSEDNLNYTKKKYVAFLGSTHFKGISDNNYSYENIFDKTILNAAISTGGLALLGTGCLYTWPENINNIINNFKNNQKIILNKLMDDSNYRRTYSGCYSTTLGTVCHEIGHLFNLGHTKDGIMGNGFDLINRVFTIKYLTEDLPDRILSHHHHHQILKSSNTNFNNVRFTKIKDSGKFLQKYQLQKDNDMTNFTINCCITLYYNKWFHDVDDDINKDYINYDIDTKKILSNKYPLKLVELRVPITEMLIKFYSFSKEDDKFEFIFSDENHLNNVCIFVINSNGNVFKKNLV